MRRLLDEGIPHIFLSYERSRIFCFEKTDLWVHTHNNEFLSQAKKFPGQAIIWVVLSTSMINWNRFNFEQQITGRKLIGSFLTKLLIQRMLKNRALIAMDLSTVEAIHDFLGSRPKIKVIPIPVNMTNQRPPKHYSSPSDTVTISYIGRSDDIWKIMPAKKILLDLVKNNKKFNLNIYTDNSAPFETHLSQIPNENVRINFITNMFGSDLQQHLAKNSDIHFSMGMSALEGAVAGLPTVLVDPSYNDFPQSYRYKWLYQTTGNSLGSFITGNEKNFDGLTMTDIVKTYQNPNQLNECAILCSEYVIENHSPSQVVKKLIALQSSATNKSITAFTPSAWFLADAVRYLKRLGASK